MSIFKTLYKIPDNSAIEKSMYSMWCEYLGSNNGKLFRYKCTNLGCQAILEANFPRYDKVLDILHTEESPIEKKWRCPLCVFPIEVRLK